MESKASTASHRLYIFVLLIFVGGFIGGFTHEYRGGVFCNAQTGNMLVMSISIATGNLTKAGYCFMSFLAYIAGAVISEFAVSKKIQAGRLKWETILIGVELAAICLLSVVPDSASYVITHIPLSIMAAMQYNTFKKMGDIGMATTFITNHTRNMGVNIEKLCETHEKGYIKRALSHLMMIVSFGAGAGVATVSGARFGSGSLLIVAAVLAFVFTALAVDDMKTREVPAYAND